MVKYRRLTRTERYQIHVLLKRGDGLRSIARSLRRSASSISRELRRNQDLRLGQPEYRPEQADLRARLWRTRLRADLRKIQPGSRLEASIRQKLMNNWSPEQVSGRLKLEGEHETVPSYSTLYRYIYQDAARGEDALWARMRKPRRARKPKNYKKGIPDGRKIQNRVWIDERPKIIEKRERRGDYERDTIRGTGSEPLILTIVDRRSKLVRLALIAKKDSARIHRTTVSLLRNNAHVHSITNDNGREFSWHEKTAKVLQCPIYFSHPYHSWERGTNENTNGLLRQYFPKGRRRSKADFTKITPAQVKAAENLLNHRPRKGLGYRTPFEVHHEP